MTDCAYGLCPPGTGALEYCPDGTYNDWTNMNALNHGEYMCHPNLQGTKMVTSNSAVTSTDASRTTDCEAGAYCP